MTKLKSILKIILIILLALCVCGLGVTLVRHFTDDPEDPDTPSDYIEVEDVDLSETQIIF